MSYNELPEWTLPFFDNFTGPYWSDGKFQGSTSNPKKKPITKLDWHSRDHDREYALCESLECLDDADWDYYQRSRNMSLGPKIIGAMPLVGNAPLRMIYKILGMGYTGADVRKKMGSSQSDLTDSEWKGKHPLKPGYEWVYREGQLVGMRPKGDREFKNLDTDVRLRGGITYEFPTEPPNEKKEGGTVTDNVINKKEPGTSMPSPPEVIPKKPKTPPIDNTPETPVVKTPPEIGSVPAVVDLRDYKAPNDSSSYNPYATNIGQLRGAKWLFANSPTIGDIRRRRKKPNKKKIYIAY